MFFSQQEINRGQLWAISNFQGLSIYQFTFNYKKDEQTFVIVQEAEMTVKVLNQIMLAKPYSWWSDFGTSMLSCHCWLRETYAHKQLIMLAWCDVAQNGVKTQGMRNLKKL